MLSQSSAAAVTVRSGLAAQVTIDHAETTDAWSSTVSTANDMIDASALTATAMALVANGGAGNDKITGGDGNDVLNGGSGKDQPYRRRRRRSVPVRHRAWAPRSTSTRSPTSRCRWIRSASTTHLRCVRAWPARRTAPLSLATRRTMPMTASSTTTRTASSSTTRTGRAATHAGALRHARSASPP